MEHRDLHDRHLPFVRFNRGRPAGIVVLVAVRSEVILADALAYRQVRGSGTARLESSGRYCIERLHQACRKWKPIVGRERVQITDRTLFHGFRCKRIVGISASTTVIERRGISGVQRRAASETLNQIRIGNIKTAKRKHVGAALRKRGRRPLQRVAIVGDVGSPETASAVSGS